MPLQIARPPVLDRSALAQLLEPPYTDPYVRWCGRGGAARLPPIPIGSLLSHQDLRATRAILLLRRNRQTYWTSTSPTASASRGPVQRANPCGGGLSSSFRIRLSVAFVKIGCLPGRGFSCGPS